MHDSFNPYRDWLGIADGRPPTTYYDLFGLRPLESDSTLISQAADRVRTRLRGIRPGPNLAQWQMLLDLVSTARTCLLDPQFKAQYDASLGGLAAPMAAAPATPPPAAAPMALPPSMQRPPSAPIMPAMPATPSFPSGAAQYPIPGGSASVAYTAPPTYTTPPTQPASSGFTPLPGSNWTRPPAGATPGIPLPGTSVPAQPAGGYPAPQLTGSSGPGFGPPPGYDRAAAAAAGPPMYPAPPQFAPLQPPSSMNSTPPGGQATFACPGSHEQSYGGSQPSAYDPAYGGAAATYPPNAYAAPTAPYAYSGATGAEYGVPTDAGATYAAPAFEAFATQVEPPAAPAAAPEYGDTMPVPPEPPPISYQSVAAEITDDRSGRASLPRRRKRSMVGLIVQLLALVILSSGGIYGYTVYRHWRAELRRQGLEAQAAAAASVASAPSDPSAKSADKPPSDEAKAQASASPEEKPRPVPPAAQSVPEAKPEPPAETEKPPSDQVAQADPAKAPAAKKDDPPVDAEKQKALQKALAEVRSALAGRDPDGAKTALEAAQPNAQNAEDQALLTQHENLLGYYNEFWHLIRGRLAKLQPAEEFEIGDKRVIVSEATADSLAIRADGKIYRYAALKIPRALVAVFADQWLAKDPSTCLIHGSFLLADGGDRKRAARLLAMAARGDLKPKELLPAELLSGAGAASAAAGQPVPSDRAKLKAADEAIRQRFQNEYEAATTSVKRMALAKQLLDEARRTTQDVETQFTLFRQAQSLAIAAGKAELLCEALDRMGAAFTIDTLALKAHLLPEAADAAKSATASRELASCALKLAEEAQQADHKDLAGQFAQLAMTAARKSQTLALMKQAKALCEQLGVGTR